MTITVITRERWGGDLCDSLLLCIFFPGVFLRRDYDLLYTIVKSPGL